MGGMTPGVASRLAARTTTAARAEQARRAARGEPFRAEDMLTLFPELNGDPEALLDLIYNEVVVRQARGAAVSLVEYQARFPDLAAPLRDLFEVHAALEAPGPTVSQPSDHGATRAFRPGDWPVLADYEVLEEIGRGGMGVVYKARHAKLDRIVALKKMIGLTSELAVARFDAEARAVARLDHPGIVPIYEVGKQDGQPFYAMAYVRGQSLERRAGAGPLPDREAVRLVRQVCEAVAHAHEHGIIHRDLKPANVLVDELGNCRLTDFGLAKYLDAPAGLTADGELLGTPHYMAPEQAAGRHEQVGPATDVYALGAILYRLLTGRPPFQASSVAEVLAAVLHDGPTPPRALNPRVDPALEDLCLRCLSKDPAARPMSARDLADQLGRSHRDEMASSGAGRVKAQQRALELERLARSRVESGLYHDALRLLGEAIRLDPDTADHFFHSALCRLMAGECVAAAREELEQAARLNPDHAPTHFALAFLYHHLGRAEQAADHVRVAIANDPTNREYRRYQTEVLGGKAERPEAADATASGQDLGPLLAECAGRLYRQVQSSVPRLHHWTEQLPPWRQLRRWPTLGALGLAAAGFALCLALQVGERRPNVVSQQALIWACAAMGLLVPSWIARWLERTYPRLLPVVTIPEPAFRRFFIAQSAHILGGGCARSAEQDGRPVRGSLRACRDHVVIAASFLAILVPLQFYCAGDPPRPSIAQAVRYFSYVFEVYTLCWVASFAVLGLRFIPRFAHLPQRYFLGMPDSVSLKPLGTFYVRVTLVGTATFVLFLIEHYVFDTHRTAGVVSTLYIVMCTTLMALPMLVAQVTIHLTLRALRRRRVTEFSYRLEETFDTAMASPTSENLQALAERRRFMRQLEALDTSGLRHSDWLLLALACLTAVGSGLVYGWLIALRG